MKKCQYVNLCSFVKSAPSKSLNDKISTSRATWRPRRNSILQLIRFESRKSQFIHELCIPSGQCPINRRLSWSYCQYGDSSFHAAYCMPNLSLRLCLSCIFTTLHLLTRTFCGIFMIKAICFSAFLYILQEKLLRWKDSSQQIPSGHQQNLQYWSFRVDFAPLP